jgi:hypothetical protein
MEQEPPREPIVERVERADGRYVIYFSWPEGEAERGAQAVPETEARDDE